MQLSHIQSVIRYLLLVVTIGCLPVLSAADVSQSSVSYFIKVQGENYISQSNVKAIVQDSYGFMWFGTRNGLNRYDGYSFREFAVDDQEMRCSNHNISALYEDDNQLLWVGTDKGVYLYNPVYF